MSWTVLLGLVMALGLTALAALARRADLRRMRARVTDRDLALRQGTGEAQLQFPIVDLSRCLGCGTCVAVCPESDVLQLVHGQAKVVTGSHCQGIAACEAECPVGAITVTLAGLDERRDVPVLTTELEAVGSPGLFLAGEVTAHALIKTAVDHGTSVAAEVARRVRRGHSTRVAAGARSGSGQPDTATPAIPATAATVEGTRGAPRVSSIARSMGAAPPSRAAMTQLGTATLDRPMTGTGTGSGSGSGLASDAGPSPAGTAGSEADVVDLCIVGAGPAGLACALEAKRQGLHFVVLDQEATPGGTVAKYPRRKMVVTKPLEMPIYGKLKGTSFTKEALMALWSSMASEQQLPLRCGEVFREVERGGDGIYRVHTQTGVYAARHVCLALGRRGTPVKLGVAGEDLPKVSYSLLDAHSYQGRRVLVVGGGDSAVEAALALSEQPGNTVTLSYRKQAFFRVRARNQERLTAAQQSGQLRVLFQSEVAAIRADSVDLSVQEDGRRRLGRLANDEVFVMAGGEMPLGLLSRSGVSFDPAKRPQGSVPAERGTGLVRALGVGFGLALAALLWAVWHADYYMLPLALRPAHAKHALLRPGLGVGLWLGVASATLIVVNLAYLLRRSPRIPLKLGSLRGWMTGHVVTGILAVLFAILHGAMAPRDTPGGYAFWALVVLLVTGAIGRYFYAWVPRAANGRELELEELKARLDRLLPGGTAARAFQEQARREVLDLIDESQWESSLLRRMLSLLGGQRRLGQALQRIRRAGREAGVEAADLADAVQMARRAHRHALMAAHFEDLRGLLGSWRYLHRWVAALMVLLAVFHVVNALI